jgi:hypothetical protein
MRLDCDEIGSGAEVPLAARAADMASGMLPGWRSIDRLIHQQVGEHLLPALGKLAAVRALRFRPPVLNFLPGAVHFFVPQSSL